MGVKSYFKKKYRYAKKKYGQFEEWKHKQAAKADVRRAKEMERLKVDTVRAQEQVKLARAKSELARVRAQERKYSGNSGGMFAGFGGGGGSSLFGNLPTFGAPASGSSNFLSGVPGFSAAPSPAPISKPKHRKRRRTHRTRPKRHRPRYRWVRQRVR